MSLVRRLWNDEAGVVISAELVLVATLLVIGMIVGLTTVRDSVVQELGDVGVAIGEVNQSFSFSGVVGHHSATAGSAFTDFDDSCETAANDDATGIPPGCIVVCGIGGADPTVTDPTLEGAAFP